jgi:hypothetical protein
MSFRVPSQQCLGCDDSGERCEHLPTEAFCLAGQPAPLIVIQPEPSAAELFSKDPIFFAQIIDGILLLLIHPAGQGDEHKPEWVKALLRFPVQSLLRIWRSGRQCPVLSIRCDFWTLRDEPDTGEIRYSYLFGLLNEIGYDDSVGCEYRPACNTMDGLGRFRSRAASI